MKFPISLPKFATLFMKAASWYLEKPNERNFVRRFVRAFNSSETL